MSNDGEEEHRLVGWNCADSNLDQSWALSLVGVWDNFTENSTTQNRTHGNAHEILTADSQSVTHDTKGNQTGLPSNLTTSTSGLTLEWDFENKLHAADVDGTSGADILQKFDALGRRVSRDDGTTTTVFVPSGQQTIADYTAGTAASSPTYRYVYASYIDEPVMRAGSTSTAKLYYHRNQQYSVTALTDTTATISERYAYDAYGKLAVFDGSGTALSGSAYGNRYTYTGREWDGELGLYHYRARMYSPDSGRFVSRDPIGFEGSPWMLYEYVLASPLNSVDPTGKARWTRSQLVCEFDAESSGLWRDDYPNDCYIYCEFICFTWRQFAEGDNAMPRRFFPFEAFNEFSTVGLPGISEELDVDIEHCGSCSPAPPTPDQVCPRVKAGPVGPWILIEPDLSIS